MTGATSREFQFELSFTSDGQPSISAIRIGEHLVEMQHEDALWNALPDELREKLIAEAWEQAEPETDDFLCDDERIARAG